MSKTVKLPFAFELTDLEKRRQPLRDILSDCSDIVSEDRLSGLYAWVNSWEPAESTESRPREPRTPLASATPFNLQALDALAAQLAVWARTERL